MLTITDYKNWALNDQRTAVALNDDGNGLVAESGRMGGFTRTFFRGAVKKMCGDVLCEGGKGWNGEKELVNLMGTDPAKPLKNAVLRVRRLRNRLYGRLSQSHCGDTP